MRRLGRIPVLLFLLGGCGAAPVVPVSPAESDSRVAEAPGDMMSMEGISLYLSDIRGDAGAARKPRVALHAERFEALDDGALRLEEVAGRFFGTAGEEVLSFRAKGGRFDEAGRETFLEGDVEARAGTLRIQLKDLRWHQPDPKQPGLAETEGPALLEKEGLRLEARGLKLRPGDGTFELGQVRGTMSLEEMTP